MKTSRTISQIDKIIYPKCNIKKEHDKESLNMICLTKTCKFYGPICTLCKKDHTGHNVIPIKTFITNLTQASKSFGIHINRIQQQQPAEEEKKQKSSLQKLQESFLQVMGLLKFQVLELSEQIQNCENKFIKEYEQIKANICDQSRKSQILNESLQFFKQKQFKDGLEYRKNISGVLKMITCVKNQFTIKNNDDEIIKEYSDKIQIYKDNIFNIQTELRQMYDNIMEKNSQKLKINRPKTSMPGSSQSVNKPLSFSSTLKAANIIIQKETSIAKLKDNNGEKVAFVNGVSSKSFQTTIKFLQFKGQPCIGVGLKDKINLKSYKFEKNTLGHGVYLISTNGYKYSHSQSTEQNANNSFLINAGQEIQMSLNNKTKKLSFKSLSDDKKVSQLNLKSLPDNLWKQLEFCIVLNAMGDKVQIV